MRLWGGELLWIRRGRNVEPPQAKVLAGRCRGKTRG